MMPPPLYNSAIHVRSPTVVELLVIGSWIIPIGGLWICCSFPPEFRVQLLSPYGSGRLVGRLNDISDEPYLNARPSALSLTLAQSPRFPTASALQYPNRSKENR